MYNNSLIKSKALSGKKVSACKKIKNFPFAALAPALSCVPLPFGEFIILVFLSLATSSVLSVLPPSVIIISNSSLKELNDSKFFSRKYSSFIVGMMMENLI